VAEDASSGEFEGGSEFGQDQAEEGQSNAPDMGAEE
jgi:hypothetical protein